MEYEIVIPAEMPIEMIGDQIAHAVWQRLGVDDTADRLVPMHFEAIRMEIRDFLELHQSGGRDLGWVRQVRFKGPEDATGKTLEEELSEVILRALSGVLEDEAAIRLIRPALPEAIREAFEPYLRPWAGGMTTEEAIHQAALERSQAEARLADAL